MTKDIDKNLSSKISGDVRTDLKTRMIYGTDASIYQIIPIGVAFPKSKYGVILAVIVIIVVNLIYYKETIFSFFK